jgi:hypothetical protein
MIIIVERKSRITGRCYNIDMFKVNLKIMLTRKKHYISRLPKDMVQELGYDNVKAVAGNGYGWMSTQHAWNEHALECIVFKNKILS